METAINVIRVIVEIGIIAEVFFYVMLMVAVNFKMRNEIVSKLDTITTVLMMILFTCFIAYNILILANKFIAYMDTYLIPSDKNIEYVRNYIMIL